MWSKVFKTGPNKNCGRQPLKKLKRYGLLHTSYGLYPLLKSENYRSGHRRCSIKKGVLKNFAKFIGNTCARVSFLI